MKTSIHGQVSLNNLLPKCRHHLIQQKVTSLKERSNLQSTKISEDEDFFLAPDKQNRKKLYIASLEKSMPTEKAYTDLTGRFPVQSLRGNNYILICYTYDGNAILSEPLKNRTAPEMI